MKNKKSKFITFILSFLPGLSHMYIGYGDRGLIYFILLGGLFFLSIGLGRFSSSGVFDMVLVVGYPILWIVALLDAFSTIDQIRALENGDIDQLWNSDRIRRENKKIIGLALSVVPGLGHMYIGQQEKGLKILTVFLLTVFLMGFLGVSLLLFILPIIWAYSFFDAFHIINNSGENSLDMDNLLPEVDLKTGGYILIIIGLISLFQKIIYPVIIKYIDHEYINYIQSFIVAFIFIIGGIYLINSQSYREDSKDED